MKTRIQQIKERANDVRRSDDFGHSTQDLLHWESQQLTIVQNDIADLLAVVEVYEDCLTKIEVELGEDDDNIYIAEAREALTKAHEIMNELQGMR